jgi:hypothetical protein
MPTLSDLIGESYADAYKVRSGDEKRFIEKHKIRLFPNIYSEKTYDDLFKGNNIKTIDRNKDRHGYNTGEDEKVYESVNQEKIKLYTGTGQPVPKNNWHAVRADGKIIISSNEKHGPSSVVDALKKKGHDVELVHEGEVINFPNNRGSSVSHTDAHFNRWHDSKVKPVENTAVMHSKAYDHYKNHAEKNSIEPMGENAFRRSMADKGLHRAKIGGRERYIGIGLKEAKDPCWKGYKKVKGKKDFEKGSCVKESLLNRKKLGLNK